MPVPGQDLHRKFKLHKPIEDRRFLHHSRIQPAPLIFAKGDQHRRRHSDEIAQQKGFRRAQHTAQHPDNVGMADAVATITANLIAGKENKFEGLNENYVIVDNWFVQIPYAVYTGE